MKGKVALVTGAGRGIGRGITASLAKEGGTVAVNYHSDRQATEKTIRTVRKSGGEVFCIQGDVSRLEEHGPLVRTILEKTSRIDLLVNNAGMAPGSGGTCSR